jgi:hypothetical protein
MGRPCQGLSRKEPPWPPEAKVIVRGMMNKKRIHGIKSFNRDFYNETD